MMSESRRKKYCKLFLLEWHYSKLFFFHHDWRIFVYTPWMPYKWPYQLAYLIYRWILALYFFSWLIVSGVSWGNPSYFIFLTNWAFVLYNMYLIVAAFSVTTKFISVHLVCKPEEDEFSHRYEIKTKPPSGCCGYSDNNINWYQMLQWFFFLMGNEISFVILFLYWILIYNGEKVDGISANTHLVNGIFSLVDFWVNGTPINPFHVIYLMIFGVVYSVFTGLYFVGSGNYVYSVLDYGTNTGLAIGLCVLVIFVVLPFSHLVVFYLQHLAKVAIMRCIFGQSYKASLTDENQEISLPDRNQEFSLTNGNSQTENESGL